MSRGATKCAMGLPHNTKRSTGETPFSMAYGTEAVIPVKVGLSSMRVSNFSSKNDDVNELSSWTSWKSAKRWL